MEGYKYSITINLPYKLTKDIFSITTNTKLSRTKYQGKKYNKK